MIAQCEGDDDTDYDIWLQHNKIKSFSILKKMIMIIVKDKNRGVL